MACGRQSGNCNGGSCDGAEQDSFSCSSSLCSDGRKQNKPIENKRLCSKCKEKETRVKANQTESVCGDCLHAGILAKFKGAVNSHGMILPTDKVLVAFSGGPASRVALEFVKEIQSKAQRDSDASRDSILHVFHVGVAFVDESTALLVDSHEACQLIEEIKFIVSGKENLGEQTHIVPIESIWSDAADCKEKLLDLLGSVHDTTGKEDLLGYLRMQVLQKVAVEHGYSKLVLGLCTSRIATHVVASTVKGQGYSLPADVQYVDARWKVPVVLPLRDCVAKELAMLCHLNSWKTVFTKALSTLAGSHFSVNSLIASFVALLQEDNPSRERTIVRTAEKLNTFSFNQLPESEAIYQLPRRRREALRNCMTNNRSSLELLCPICSGPLNDKDFMEIINSLGTDSGLRASLVAIKNGATTCDLPSSIFQRLCCPSCQFQILHDQKPSSQHIHSLLPDVMKKRAVDNLITNESWMRRRIEDCLLSQDDEDEPHDACLNHTTEHLERLGE